MRPSCLALPLWILGLSSVSWANPILTSDPKLAAILAAEERLMFSGSEMAEAEATLHLNSAMVRAESSTNEHDLFRAMLRYTFYEPLLEGIKISRPMHKRFEDIETQPRNREELLLAFMRYKQSPSSSRDRSEIAAVERQLNGPYRDNPMFFLTKIRGGRSTNITANDFDEQIAVATRLSKKLPLQKGRFISALAQVHRAGYIILGRPSDKLGMKNAIEELKKGGSDPWGRIPRAEKHYARLSQDRDSYVKLKLAAW